MANTNELLVYGWTVQSNVATGFAGAGYAMPGNAPVPANVSTALQASGGLPYPAGSENVQGENSGSQAVQILTNPGFAVSPALMTPGPVTPPAIPGSTVAQANPYGVPVSVMIIGGTVTVVATAPANSSTFTTVGGASPTSVVIPPGGSIKLTYSVVPTSWSWTLTI